MKYLFIYIRVALLALGQSSMYNHKKAQQIKNRVHISWDILYVRVYFISSDECFKTVTQSQYFWVGLPLSWDRYGMINGVREVSYKFMCQKDISLCVSFDCDYLMWIKGKEENTWQSECGGREFDRTSSRFLKEVYAVPHLSYQCCTRHQTTTWCYICTFEYSWYLSRISMGLAL